MKDTSKHVYCELDYFLSRGIARQRYEAVAVLPRPCLCDCTAPENFLVKHSGAMQQARMAVCTLANGRR